MPKKNSRCDFDLEYFFRAFFSIDHKKLDDVVAEIKDAGGDAIGVPGDVAADEFPKNIVDATVKFVCPCVPLSTFFLDTPLFRKYGKINHIVNNGQLAHLNNTPPRIRLADN